MMRAMAAKTKDDVGAAWARVEEWMAKSAPALAKRLPAPASKAELAACERALGVKLPDDLRASLARHGGDSDWGGVELVGNWSLLDVTTIAREHALMKRLVDDGVLDAAPEPNPRIAPVWWSASWIPIVSSGSGHQICVDMGPGPQGTRGQVILFLHDDGKRFCLADSFAAWWSAIARGLTEGRLAWDAAEERFADEAFLSIALEGQDLYRPKPKAKGKRARR
jgi:cell wall assembly regulator SMI1